MAQNMLLLFYNERQSYMTECS